MSISRKKRHQIGAGARAQLVLRRIVDEQLGICSPNHSVNPFAQLQPHTHAIRSSLGTVFVALNLHPAEQSFLLLFVATSFVRFDEGVKARIDGRDAVGDGRCDTRDLLKHHTVNRRGGGRSGVAAGVDSE